MILAFIASGAAVEKRRDFVSGMTTYLPMFTLQEARLPRSYSFRSASRGLQVAGAGGGTLTGMTNEKERAILLQALETWQRMAKGRTSEIPTASRLASPVMASGNCRHFSFAGLRVRGPPASGQVS